MTLRKILATVLFFSMILCTSNSDAAVSDEDFIEICGADSAEEVEEALKTGADVNAKSKSGHTALIGAAIFNHLEVVSLLLKSGADVNCSTPKINGETPL